MARAVLEKIQGEPRRRRGALGGRNQRHHLGNPGSREKMTLPGEDGEGDLGLTVDSSSLATSFYITSKLQHIQYITPTFPSLQFLLPASSCMEDQPQGGAESREFGHANMETLSRAQNLIWVLLKTLCWDN